MAEVDIACNKPKVLVRPLTDQDEKAFFEGLNEWEGDDLDWYTFTWKPGMSYSDMIKILRNEESGRELAPGRVPHTMLYGFVGDKIIGRVSVRHELNDYLRRRGGHIGYAVAKKYRQKGYAKEMVKQALKYCEKLGIDSVMVTCADSNMPSWKIVEHFKGALQDRVWDEEHGEMIRRYWIALP